MVPFSVKKKKNAKYSYQAKLDAEINREKYAVNMSEVCHIHSRKFPFPSFSFQVLILSLHVSLYFKTSMSLCERWRDGNANEGDVEESEGQESIQTQQERQTALPEGLQAPSDRQRRDAGHRPEARHQLCPQREETGWQAGLLEGSPTLAQIRAMLPNTNTALCKPLQHLFLENKCLWWARFKAASPQLCFCWFINRSNYN